MSVCPPPALAPGMLGEWTGRSPHGEVRELVTKREEQLQKTWAAALPGASAPGAPGVAPSRGDRAGGREVRKEARPGGRCHVKREKAECSLPTPLSDFTPSLSLGPQQVPQLGMSLLVPSESRPRPVCPVVPKSHQPAAPPVMAPTLFHQAGPEVVCLPQPHGEHR